MIERSIIQRSSTTLMSRIWRRPKTVTVEAGNYTITVSGEALDSLLDVAQREGRSLADVLAHAIAVQKAVTDAKAQGRKVYIEPKGDSPRQLVTA